MKKHTPGPWRASAPGEGDTLGWCVYADDNSEYADADGLMIVADNLTPANAAFIVEACSTHDELTVENKAMIEAAVGLAAQRDDLADALEKCLVFVDKYRVLSGGEGDIAAMNARHYLKRAGR